MPLAYHDFQEVLRIHAVQPPLPEPSALKGWPAAHL
jgi:hypothetical protein